LQAIRTGIRDVSLPTWVQRPPTNLGEAQHGKLKAYEYLTLFIWIFPLIIPEIWYSIQASDHDHDQLECFHHLVSATNIVSSFTTSFAKADEYTHHYTHYRILVQKLFPHFPSKPNHHYAMHNGNLMKRWGPLPCLSENFGERVNGMLQRINTNSRLNDLDLTMLRQISRRGRLEAKLHDGADKASKKLAPILDPPSLFDSKSHGDDNLRVNSLWMIKASALNDSEYDTLLSYLHQTGRPYRRWDSLPHPDGSLVLRTTVARPRQTVWNNHTFSCQKSHKGNSAIYFFDPTTQSRRTGFIEMIWELPLDNILRIFVVVRAHQILPPDIEAKAPFLHYSGFQTRILYSQPSNELIIIEPIHIITHLTTLERPTGTYGINCPTLVVCWALDRGQQH
ncbi:hypothetical protein GALMADRAFT_82353, partial [Galerina marginata CBS 339.88]